MSELELFDLTALADNGLRRGRTTGTCATAAVRAALEYILYEKELSEVAVTLPDNKHYLRVPLKAITRLSSNSAKVEVVKFAGDDPDQTDGATIFAIVTVNNTGTVKFIAGPGVGTVTAPGIRVPVGEPAINPGPRDMIKATIAEVLNGQPDPGFDVTIGCENGLAIAKKTFNPRLGIIGGISILGTTGIVEPMSLAAYQASIEVYVRVALFDGSPVVAYLPGNLGLTFAQKKLNLGTKQIVHVSNFVGFAIDATEAALREQGRTLPFLWLLGHPGKLAKILDNHWDTHSRSSPMAMNTLADLAREIGLRPHCEASIRSANTVEAILQDEVLEHEVKPLWTAVKTLLTEKIKSRAPSIVQPRVNLYSMNGAELAEEDAA